MDGWLYFAISSNLFMIVNAGPFCTESGQTGCISCQCDNGCNADTGRCISGSCKAGWYGDNCQTENVAYLKNAAQSTTFTTTRAPPYFTASRAVDGNTADFVDGVHQCIYTAPLQTEKAWWRVDLGKSYSISRLTIHNKPGNGPHLDGFMIEVTNNAAATSGTRCYTHTGPPLGGQSDEIAVQCTSPLYGSVVIIKAGTDVLNMLMFCEVQIFVCNLGLYGESCFTLCQCKLGLPCNATTGDCTHGCNDGWEGSKCDMACAAGTYGSNCSESCGNCACHHVSGACHTGCNGGWHGAACNETCAVGTYGSNCSESCGNCASGAACDHVSGACHTGCSGGWHGAACNETCAAGTYGSNCSESCGNCASGAACDHVSGACHTGCRGGWHGAACKETCAAGTYGSNCSDSCGNCASGAACDHVSGACHTGCNVGWHGAACNESICETADGELCANTDWVDSTEGKFECNGLNSSDVQSVTLRFPLSRVPSKETTQTCFPFNLPSAEEFHVIATEPFINNSYVMHHIQLFGCSDTASLDMSQTGPTECNMLSAGCDTQLGGWTVGIPGQCLNNKTGIPFGLNGVKRAILQFHWNNPLHIDDYFDSSGFTIYYTANKRQYDLQRLVLGQLSLNIQPGQPAITFTARCSFDCTSSLLKDTIYVVQSSNHMHYLGRSATMKQYRRGQLVRTIGDEPGYSYDSPAMFEYDPPLEILPGDDLVATCGFSSSNRVNKTTYGPDTSSEMCFPSLIYYSDVAADNNYITCWQYKTVDLCKLDARNNFPVIDGCRWQELTDRENPTTKQMIDEVTDTCVFNACTDECYRVIQNMKEHPCFQGDLGEYLYMLIAHDPTNQQFIAALSTCDNVVGRAGQLMALSWVLLATMLVILFQ